MISKSSSAGGITGRGSARSVRGVARCAGSYAWNRTLTPGLSLCSRGIADQVDALGIGWIVDLVQPPIVEQPSLAGRHMYPLAIAGELNLRSGQDRHVHAHAMEPVMMHVGMHRYLGAGREPQKPRATPDDSETRQHLTHVGQALEMRGHAHHAVHFFVVSALYADQPYCVIPRIAVWVARPSVRRQGGHLDAQPLVIKAHRQSIETLRETHQRRL
jgi:hypothetical protein